jgi:hypothetical protein
LKSQLARPDDSRPARISPVAADGSMTEGSRREVADAVPRPEALDPKWQSAIDAATD